MRRQFVIFNYDGNRGREVVGKAMRRAWRMQKYGDRPHHVEYLSTAALVRDGEERDLATPRWLGEATEGELGALVAEIQYLYDGKCKRKSGDPKVRIGNFIEIYHD